MENIENLAINQLLAIQDNQQSQIDPYQIYLRQQNLKKVKSGKIRFKTPLSIIKDDSKSTTINKNQNKQNLKFSLKKLLQCDLQSSGLGIERKRINQNTSEKPLIKILNNSIKKKNSGFLLDLRSRGAVTVPPTARSPLRPLIQHEGKRNLRKVIEQQSQAIRRLIKKKLGQKQLKQQYKTLENEQKQKIKKIKRIMTQQNLQNRKKIIINLKEESNNYRHSEHLHNQKQNRQLTIKNSSVPFFKQRNIKTGINLILKQRINSVFQSRKPNNLLF